MWRAGIATPDTQARTHGLAPLCAATARAGKGGRILLCTTVARAVPLRRHVFAHQPPELACCASPRVGRAGAPLSEGSTRSVVHAVDVSGLEKGVRPPRAGLPRWMCCCCRRRARGARHGLLTAAGAGLRCGGTGPGQDARPLVARRCAHQAFVQPRSWRGGRESYRKGVTLFAPASAEVKQWVKAHCPENAAARSMVERLDMDTETAADEVGPPPPCATPFMPVVCRTAGDAGRLVMVAACSPCGPHRAAGHQRGCVRPVRWRGLPHLLRQVPAVLPPDLCRSV